MYSYIKSRKRLVLLLVAVVVGSLASSYVALDGPCNKNGWPVYTKYKINDCEPR
jgi:hypothetical protein